MPRIRWCGLLPRSAIISLIGWGTNPCRDGRLFFEALLPRETITATLIARAEKVDAAGAAQVREQGRDGPFFTLPQRVQHADVRLIRDRLFLLFRLLHDQLLPMKKPDATLADTR